MNQMEARREIATAGVRSPKDVSYEHLKGEQGSGKRSSLRMIMVVVVEEWRAQEPVETPNDCSDFTGSFKFVMINPSAVTMIIRERGVNSCSIVVHKSNSLNNTESIVVQVELK